MLNYDNLVTLLQLFNDNIKLETIFLLVYIFFNALNSQYLSNYNVLLIRS